ncbi:MAG: ABC transporter permease subunit, partial [Cyclobacteriaceae bacterium]|nr:ABC transporter permease subunit [Cyclobacteriaceae bacterium]
MLYLLQIEFKKLRHYRTFWVIGGLYFLTLGMTTATGMEFLKMLVRLGAQFDTQVNINRIPIYHFPDVWHNLSYISGFFKIVLAMLVVISVTNEFTYRTLRQNVIDGLSRWEFLEAKILMNAVLSLVSVGMVFVIAFITGLIYTP